MNWIGSAVVALAAVAILVKRRDVASLQANILGGSVLPGCVVAEAVALFVIAAALFLVA